MMLHTNPKSERCERWNNEVITLPFSFFPFTHLKHLHIATSLDLSLDPIWIQIIDIHAYQHH